MPRWRERQALPWARASRLIRNTCIGARSRGVFLSTREASRLFWSGRTLDDGSGIGASGLAVAYGSTAMLVLQLPFVDPMSLRHSRSVGFSLRCPLFAECWATIPMRGDRVVGREGRKTSRPKKSGDINRSGRCRAGEALEQPVVGLLAIVVVSLPLGGRLGPVLETRRRLGAVRRDQFRRLQASALAFPSDVMNPREEMWYGRRRGYPPRLPGQYLSLRLSLHERSQRVCRTPNQKHGATPPVAAACGAVLRDSAM